MSTTKQFNTTLREWAEIFMTRSMRGWMHFVKSSGLSMPQFTIIMRLYHHGMCGVSDVSSHLEVTNAAASQLVDRLVQQGLLDRAEDPHDRRAKQITLSAKGRALVEKGIEARHRWLEGLGDKLLPDQQVMVTEALICLMDATRNMAE